MITPKLILAIICYINFQTSFVDGQAVSRSNGDTSSTSSTELRFGVPPPLNNLYQPVGDILSGLSTISRQLFPGSALQHQHLYNYYDPGYAYNRQQYQQTQSPGYNGNYNRPYINIYYPFGQWPGNNENYNVGRPNSNFNQNPSINQPTNFANKPQAGATRPYNNPSWNINTSNQNYDQMYVKNQPTTRPDGIKTQTPWSSGHYGLVSEHAADPLKVNKFPGGLVTEIAEDPLNVKNSQPSFISGSTWSSGQSSLVSEPAANPLKVNKFQNTLVSEVVDDPLNTKNTQGRLTNVPARPNISGFRPPTPSPWSSSQSSLVSEPAANPLKVNKPQNTLISEIVNDPLNTRNARENAVRKTKPGAIINPDSPYYIDAGSNDPSSLIDIRSD